MRRPGLASLPALLLVVAAGCDTTVTAVDGPVFDLSELPDLGVARDLADGSSDLVVIVPLPDQAMVPPDQAIAPPDQRAGDRSAALYAFHVPNLFGC